VRDACREHDIAETLYYGWRDKLLEGGEEVLAGKQERHSGSASCERRSPSLDARLGAKTYELEVAGEALRGWE